MCAGHMVQGMARSGGGAATRPWKNLRPRQMGRRSVDTDWPENPPIHRVDLSVMRHSPAARPVSATRARPSSSAIIHAMRLLSRHKCTPQRVNLKLLSSEAAEAGIQVSRVFYANVR